MTHTPGPWTARREGGTWYVEVGRDQDYFDICELFGGGDKMEANARLIAAAPELLDALKDLDTRIMPEERKYDEWDYCRIHKDILYEFDAIVKQALALVEGDE